MEKADYHSTELLTSSWHLAVLRQGYLEASVNISVQEKSFPSAFSGSLVNEEDYKTDKYLSACSVSEQTPTDMKKYSVTFIHQNKCSVLVNPQAKAHSLTDPWLAH